MNLDMSPERMLPNADTHKNISVDMDMYREARDYFSLLMLLPTRAF